MYFPIAETSVCVAYLLVTGFAGGVCGGFWGVGGGCIVTPTLYALGVPMNIAIGSDMAHIFGKSIISSLRHAKYGNLSLKIGLIMVPGTMLGVEMGAQILQYLKRLGEREVNGVISILYIVLLTTLALFTFLESWRSKKILDRENNAADDDTTSAQTRQVEDRVTADFAAWAGKLRIPPYLSCAVARIERQSVWVVVMASLVTGLLAGLLGVGGGFLRMPMLVYLVGCPTHVAVGTDLFSIAVSGAYGTFTHGLKGNVDIMMAVLMLVSAAVGAQVGTFATRYAHGAQVRTLFAAWLLTVAIAVFAKTYMQMPAVSLVVMLGTAGGMSALIIGYLIRGVAAARADDRGPAENAE